MPGHREPLLLTNGDHLPSTAPPQDEYGTVTISMHRTTARRYLLAASVALLALGILLSVEVWRMFDYAKHGNKYWRPGSDLFGYLVGINAGFLLCVAALGLLASALHHPVTLGVFAGSAVMLLYFQAAFAGLYLNYKDLMRQGAVFDLTNGLQGFFDFMDHHGDWLGAIAMGLLALQASAIFTSVLQGHLLAGRRGDCIAPCGCSV